MSYDVYIGSENFNYTSNGSAIFYDHMPATEGRRGGLHELNGLTGKAAAAVIRDALRRINRTRLDMWSNPAAGDDAFCNRYDPPNKWGSTVGALLFLSQILAECAAQPRCKVRVSA
jgi:hypothetical protein